MLSEVHLQVHHVEQITVDHIPLLMYSNSRKLRDYTQNGSFFDILEMFELISLNRHKDFVLSRQAVVLLLD